MKTLISLAALVVILIFIWAWHEHEANKGFTPWMTAAELDRFLSQYDTSPPGGHPNYWDRGHWIDAVEGRWREGVPQYRIQYSAVPDGYNAEWYWYINQDQQSYSQHVHEFADRGMVLLDPNSFLRPDDTRRYQGVWHLLTLKPRPVEGTTASSNVASATVAPVPTATQPPLPNNRTWAPYNVLDSGVKLHFSEITKKDLGRRCSVFLKRGVLKGWPPGVRASKAMYVLRGNVQIINGELLDKGAHFIGLTWYPSQTGHGQGGTIPESEIDYVKISPP